MDRFLKYTTQKEPALTVSVIAALLLALVARFVPGLTDADFTILGPVAMIIAGVLIRAGVFSPFSVGKRTRQAYDEGHVDGQAARQKKGS